MQLIDNQWVMKNLFPSFYTIFVKLLIFKV